MIEKLKDGGLTTAALAAAVEPKGLKKNLDLQIPETELTQIDVPAGDALTRASNGGADTGTAAVLAMREQSPPLFSTEEAAELHASWDAIQGSFVDEPRQAVGQADSLVAGAMKRLAEMFADERAKLDAQWDRGASVSTEDLRLALRCYRSFFGRLLSV